MPAVKKVLGHVRVQKAKRDRQCERNKDDHTIRSGKPCLQVKNPNYPDTWWSYCDSCGNEILAQAKADLAKLEAELKS